MSWYQLYHASKGFPATNAIASLNQGIFNFDFGFSSIQHQVIT